MDEEVPLLSLRNCKIVLSLEFKILYCFPDMITWSSTSSSIDSKSRSENSTRSSSSLLERYVDCKDNKEVIGYCRIPSNFGEYKGAVVIKTVKVAGCGGGIVKESFKIL